MVYYDITPPRRAKETPSSGVVHVSSTISMTITIITIITIAAIITIGIASVIVIIMIIIIVIIGGRRRRPPRVSININTLIYSIDMLSDYNTVLIY